MRVQVSQTAIIHIIFDAICALTSKPSAYRYRPWEITEQGAIDCNRYFWSKHSCIIHAGTNIMRILPKSKYNIKSKFYYLIKFVFLLYALLNQRNK